MLKKKLVAVLSSAALLSTLVGNAMAATSFTDVPSDSPYASYIQDLSSKGIVSGVGNGQFAPMKTLTRAEMATFLVRAFGIPQNTSSSVAFTDIRGHWAESYIKSAYAAGMIAGKSATTFAPDAPVTREEAAQMVWNYLSKNGVQPSSRVYNLPNIGKLDSWAQSAVGNLMTHQLIGPSNFSDWTAPMTRQEAAAVIDLAVKALSQKSQPAPVPPVSSESSPGTSSSSGSSGMLPASADNLKTNSDGTLSPTNVAVPAEYTSSQPKSNLATPDEIKNLMEQVKFKVDGTSVTVTLPDTNDSKVTWYVNSTKASKPYESSKGTTLTFNNEIAVGIALQQPYNVGSGVYLTATFKNTNGQWTLQYR
jgi:hypothetical protein